VTAVDAFLKKMEDEAFRAAFEGATTPEAKEGVLAEAGLDISVAEAEAALGELSEEELDQVAGGGAGVIRYPPD
jgi:predicted ribosomally synthesized peptide with nif11-like leader